MGFVVFTHGQSRPRERYLSGGDTTTRRADQNTANAFASNDVV